MECQTSHWKEHKRLCIKGSSAASKCDKNGIPKKYKSTAKAEIQKHGLAKLQQDLLLERSGIFFAGADGTFQIRDLTSRHRVVELSHLQNCQQYQVEWLNHREGAERKGQDEFMFLSAASLALEMHALTLGKADPHFKYLEGNFLYLVGEPHLFWSMMVHHKMTGMCLPFEGQTHQKWEETWCIQELEKMVTPMMTRGLTGAQAPALKMNSRSLATVEFMQQKNNDNLFGVKLEELYIPTDAALLPPWWGECNELWTSLLKRTLAAKGSDGASGRVPCMFDCCPSTCMAGEASCIGHHDLEFKTKIFQIKKNRPNY